MATWFLSSFFLLMFFFSFEEKRKQQQQGRHQLKREREWSETGKRGDQTTHMMVNKMKIIIINDKLAALVNQKELRAFPSA